MVFIPTDDGNWVDENYERLARVVMEYDPYLKLAWIPPDKRTRDDKKPYCIIDTRLGTDNKESVVMYASELDKPHEILAKLIQIDNKDTLVIDRLEAEDAARRLLSMQEFADKLAEAHEKANFLFNTPLHYIELGRDDDGKKIRMDESRRRI